MNLDTRINQFLPVWGIVRTYDLEMHSCVSKANEHVRFGKIAVCGNCEDSHWNIIDPFERRKSIRDAAATFADTLKSTRGFGEVVVYDNGSNDATIEIAQAHENVSLHQGNFMGFGPTKNHAVSLAKNDWVLSLDADEAISSELRQFLERWVPESSHCVGLIRRDNYLMGKLGAIIGHDCAGENPVADQAQRGSTPGTVPGENRQIFRNSPSNQQQDPASRCHRLPELLCLFPQLFHPGRHAGWLAGIGDCMERIQWRFL
jgi:hypothetical protein